MSRNSLLLSVTFVACLGLSSVAAMAQPAGGVCPPPCYLDLYKPCPSCNILPRCSCPPKAGGTVGSGSGSYGKAEIHRKNVPQVRKGRAPPYD